MVSAGIQESSRGCRKQARGSVARRRRLALQDHAMRYVDYPLSII